MDLSPRLLLACESALIGREAGKINPKEEKTRRLKGQKWELEILLGQSSRIVLKEENPALCVIGVCSFTV